MKDKELLLRMSGKFLDETVAARHYHHPYRVIVRMLNALSLLYCRVMRIKVIELK